LRYRRVPWLTQARAFRGRAEWVIVAGNPAAQRRAPGQQACQVSGAERRMAISMSVTDAGASALAADGAMYALADGLTGEGFDISGPALDGLRYLKVMNVRGTWCEIIVRENGVMRWDYRPFGCGRPDPHRAIEITLAALGAGGREFSLPGEFSVLSFKGVVGRVLCGRDMQVRMGAVIADDFFYDSYSEIVITNPARAERGTVWVSDDGVVRWECQYGEDAGRASLRDITETIARVLESGRLR
jgi:hypothetical protein